MRSAPILFRHLNLRGTAPWIAAIFVPLAAASLKVAECADTVFFKDGMRTVCRNRAWEENGEVRCEYDGGVLVYSKSEVSHIEKGPSMEDDPVSKKDHEQAGQPKQRPAAALSRQPTASSSTSLKPSARILFYDPRRAKKYWSSDADHHDSYQDAIAALAAEFNRPPQWIEENIGDTNDLEEIRANLAATRQAAKPATAGSSNYGEGERIDFYNPRRPQKYWTARDAHHNTFAEAMAAFAKEFGKPAAWIEAHMGESNDLESIRHSLQEAQQAEKSK